MRGKLIVIEGADATGKETISKCTVQALNDSYLNENTAHLKTFPQYEGAWGRLIKEYLEGQFGGLNDVNPYLASLLYTGDRSLVAAEMHETLNRGDWIVCDRYLQSNFAYQGVKISNIEERNKFVDWLQDKEYNEFILPQPDKIIILDLSSTIKESHIAERRKSADRRELKDERQIFDRRRIDIHEDNLDYLSRVSLEYNRLAHLRNWDIINCSSDGAQLSREEVLDKILEIIFGESSFSLKTKTLGI